MQGDRNIETEKLFYIICSSYLIMAPMIIGKAHNWKLLLRPTPSAIHPLNRDPIKAPPKHILTTRPS